MLLTTPGVITKHFSSNLRNSIQLERKIFMNNITSDKQARLYQLGVIFSWETSWRFIFLQGNVECFPVLFQEHNLLICYLKRLQGKQTQLKMRIVKNGRVHPQRSCLRSATVINVLSSTKTNAFDHQHRAGLAFVEYVSDF